MPFSRRCGILLHPTSLPGPHGIGDLGAGARRFVDFLAAAGQRYWQICPLGPTGFGDSPYQCFSAFAGNPMLIDLAELEGMGLLTPGDFAGMPAFSPNAVDFGPLIEWKNAMLQTAFERFSTRGASAPFRAEFKAFCDKNALWLEDFALFMALKEAHGGGAWTGWDASLLHRKPAALKEWSARLSAAVERRRFDQFLFCRQWKAIKNYANERGVQIIGDAPIFVAHDSADVWANPQLFHLDEAGQPTVVAGVPPDYFSETGQRWGNPLYKWPAHVRSKFAWWIARFHALLEFVDVIRVDHFRGFESCWEIPASEPTAVHGKWVKSPGSALFRTVREALGALPIIAEDLGVITPEVDALRLEFEFPGMKIVQFGFSADADPESVYLPHNFSSPDYVVYTGTHDNDTTVGWYRSQPEKVRDHVRRYCWCDGSNVAWDLIRLAYMSVANLAIVPLQDVLAIGSEGRMNFPGRPEGNWSWRARGEALTSERAEGLKKLAALYGRLPGKEEKA